MANQEKQLRIRIDSRERRAFDEAARLSGISLSSWVRIILREAAEARLRTANKKPEWVQ